jgi:hypothetical protein
VQRQLAIAVAGALTQQSGALNRRIGKTPFHDAVRGRSEVAVKLSRQTICASFWNVKRESGRVQRTPATRAVTAGPTGVMISWEASCCPVRSSSASKRTASNAPVHRSV